MTSNSDLLLALPPLAPAELIDKLLTIRQRWKTDPEAPVPLTTFHLLSGRDVTGWVLAQKISPQGDRVLTIQSGEDGRARGWTITYLQVARIEAVTLHDARSAAHFLSDGLVPAPSMPGDQPPPTRLQLKRKAQQLAERLASDAAAGLELEVDWDSLAESGEPLRALEHLLQNSVDVLVSIAGEPMGKAELAKLERVRLVDGPTAEVTRNDAVLVIAANFEAGPAGRLTLEQLRVAIEKLL